MTEQTARDLRASARKHTFYVPLAYESISTRPLFSTYDIYVLLRSILCVRAYAYIYTLEHAVCVYVYKSDLIEPDDSSANIRALTANAQTFIAFEVDAMRGHRTILEYGRILASYFNIVFLSYKCPLSTNNSTFNKSVIYIPIYMYVIKTITSSHSYSEKLFSKTKNRVFLCKFLVEK